MPRIPLINSVAFNLAVLPLVFAANYNLVAAKYHKAGSLLKRLKTHEPLWPRLNKS
jgi:hypothetical protein